MKNFKMTEAHVKVLSGPELGVSKRHPTGISFEDINPTILGELIKEQLICILLDTVAVTSDGKKVLRAYKKLSA